MTDKTPEEYLEEARKLIGMKTKPRWLAHPVEHSMLERYCMMGHNNNPMFYDLDYAENTKYGTLVAPAMSIHVCDGSWRWPGRKASPEQTLPEVPTPGRLNVAMGITWYFYKPAKLGDKIYIIQRLKDVYIKGIRRDPKCFWIVRENSYYNQDEELLATMEVLTIHFRSQEQIVAARGA